MTDGQSAEPVQDVIAEAKALRDIGVEIFSLGIGPSTNQTELELIADKPVEKHVFSVETFVELENDAFASDVLQQIDCLGRLSRFLFSLQDEVIELILTQPADDFDPTSITLRGGLGTEAPTYTLTGGTITEEGNTVTIALTKEDISRIKLTPGLADSFDTTFISFDGTIVNDTFGIPFKVILPEDALPPISYESDSEGPELLNFLIDMPSQMVTLDFNEPIDLSTFDVTRFILFSQKELDDANTFRLSNDSAVVGLGGSGSSVAIVFGNIDYSAITSDTTMWVSRKTALLGAEAGYVKDTSGNDASALTPFKADRASLYEEGKLVLLAKLFLR